MADQKATEEEVKTVVEPELSVGLTRLMWILVAAVVWQAYIIQTLEDTLMHYQDDERIARQSAINLIVDQNEAMVEGTLEAQLKELKAIIDHEMDDANDNYEKSLQLLVEGRCNELAQ